MAQNFMNYIGDLNLRDENLQAFDGKRGQMLPEGRYAFEIKEFELGESKGTPSNPVLRLTNEVIEDPDNVGVKGKTQRSTYTLLADNEFSRGRMKRLVEACGIELDDKGGFDASQLVGRRYWGTVVHETGRPGVDKAGNETPAPVFAKICEEDPYDVEEEEALVEQKPATQPRNGSVRRAYTRQPRQPRQ